MLATMSPTLELPFDAVELPRNASLVPWEAPWIDLSGREVEGDEFAFLAACVVCVAIISVVAVAAMVTGSSMDAGVNLGPFGLEISVN